MTKTRKRAAIVYSNRSRAISIEKKILAQKRILDEAFDVSIVDTSKASIALNWRVWIGSNRILMRDSFSLASLFIALVAGRKTVLEVNRPYGNFEGKRSRTFQKIRLFVFMFVFFRVQKIVCVTKEIEDSFGDTPFASKTFTVPNLASYDKLDVERATVPKEDDLSFAFVGDLSQAWQGKEIVQELLARLPESHLLYIGKKTTFPENLNARVTQLGVMTDDEEIITECAKCHIGLSTLNFTSRKMVEASPLKHGLYVTAGLWIIAGCNDRLLEGSYPIRSVNGSQEDIDALVDDLSSNLHLAQSKAACDAKTVIQNRVQDLRANYVEILK